ncbi:transposase [Achromatium sp. WMS3]|nr:transposase [Achromatium sp. WMS3]
MLPNLRKTVVSKLALVVGAMIDEQTPNTSELANVLPLDTKRQDMREQWLRRLLKNKLLDCKLIMEPFARNELEKAANNGQVILLSMDQTDLGDRMAVIVISVRIGDRALPLIWLAEEGSANISFEGQQKILEQVLSWLPVNATVMLLADRFYPSIKLINWLNTHSWQYRIRLKSNLTVVLNNGEKTTTGVLAEGVTERCLSNILLFAQGVSTNIGIWHETGHKQPWIIAMDCPPTLAKVKDYSAWWSIEPMFSDFKGRGFELEDSKLQHADRLERLILIMTLAMYWCVNAGIDDALKNPTPI